MKKEQSLVMGQQGFTVVELITSVTVLGIMILSVASLFHSTQVIQRRTNRYEQATRLATQKLESLRNNNYNALVPGEAINFTNEIPADQLPNAEGIVTISEPTPGIRRADVSVQYDDNISRREVLLSSLIGVIGITQ